MKPFFIRILGALGCRIAEKKLPFCYIDEQPLDIPREKIIDYVKTVTFQSKDYEVVILIPGKAGTISRIRTPEELSASLGRDHVIHINSVPRPVGQKILAY